jgi:hypothetical protein
VVLEGVANWTALVGVELYPHGDLASQTADCSWDYESVNQANDLKLVRERHMLAIELRKIVSSAE